ncbi:MAG: hypothetical protein HWD61_03185 [Parachlamydiaceae bacterium]|nr:MAG: hypothetical protein HWD61_03185 [Parachlamydiaceae bacterium]
MNSLIPSVWVALGRAEEYNKQYESALLAYLMALELNSEDLNPLLDCLRCLKQLKRLDEANLLIDKALEYLKQHPELEEYKNQILLQKSKLAGSL